jgi:hypothetical protein
LQDLLEIILFSTPLLQLVVVVELLKAALEIVQMEALVVEVDLMDQLDNQDLELLVKALMAEQHLEQQQVAQEVVAVAVQEQSVLQLLVLLEVMEALVFHHL